MMHGMVDLETLDTKPSCVVLSLGAIKFDPTSNTEPHSELYFKFCVYDQDRLGRTTSDSTIEWWGKQEAKARDEAFDQTGAISVEEALKRLSKWSVGVDTIWGQGYGFDLTILEDMYRNIGKPIPWNFWQIKDSRTLFGCCKTDPRKLLGQNDLHNALADSYFQARGVQLAYKELGLLK
jgi:hypothetical protein